MPFKRKLKKGSPGPGGKIGGIKIIPKYVPPTNQETEQTSPRVARRKPSGKAILG